MLSKKRFSEEQQVLLNLNKIKLPQIGKQDNPQLNY